MVQPGLETEQIPPGAETKKAPRVSATRARQGSWGRHILWVLVISTALAAIALLGSMALNSGGVEGGGGQSRATVGGSYDTPMNTPRQTEDSPVN
jgi:hypothetical protein